jgi:hypothetical protein
MSIFRSGEKIGTAVLHYGAIENASAGEFVIVAKMKDHCSSLYDAKLPYTLRLTHDGISIHESDGEALQCNGGVGVPLEYPEKLCGRPVGDPVLVVS